MDLGHKLLALLTALLLVLGAFFATQWLGAHDDYLRAAAQVKTDQSALAQLAKQQSDLVVQFKQTQVEQASQLSALKKQIRAGTITGTIGPPDHQSDEPPAADPCHH